jgi:hypothetical protein
VQLEQLEQRVPMGQPGFKGLQAQQALMDPQVQQVLPVQTEHLVTPEQLDQRVQQVQQVLPVQTEHLVTLDQQVQRVQQAQQVHLVLPVQTVQQVQRVQQVQTEHLVALDQQAQQVQQVQLVQPEQQVQQVHLVQQALLLPRQLQLSTQRLPKRFHCFIQQRVSQLARLFR